MKVGCSLRKEPRPETQCCWSSQAWVSASAWGICPSASLVTWKRTKGMRSGPAMEWERLGAGGGTGHQADEAGLGRVCSRLCGKSFNRMYSLLGHMHLHAGSKPFKCPYCSSKFQPQGQPEPAHERSSTASWTSAWTAKVGGPHAGDGAGSGPVMGALGSPLLSSEGSGEAGQA